MLFLSPIKKKLNALDNELTLPLLSHIQKVVQHVSEHAMELASHCGRKNVSVKDVAQASSGLCLTCAPYDANENTCKLITSSTLQKGGSSPYENWCGGNKQQCGTSGNAICLFSGGRRKKTRTTKKNRKTLKNLKHHNVLNLGTQDSKMCNHPHISGGNSYYQGFCGQPFNLTQCIFSDNDSNPIPPIPVHRVQVEEESAQHKPFVRYDDVG